jgi:hypothetical protein
MMKRSRKPRQQSKEPRRCNFKLPAEQADEGLKRMTEAVSQIIKVSKAELDKREAADKLIRRRHPAPAKRRA